MRRPAHGGRRRAAQQLLQKGAARLARRCVCTQHIKAAVGRAQRSHNHAALRQQRHPGTVRPQACPAAATQRQHHRLGGHPHLACRCGKAQRPLLGPAQPAVAHVEQNPLPAQALQPSAQQRRGLHVGGEHAARGAHKGLHPQPLRPSAQLRAAKSLNQRLNLWFAPGIATHKRRVGLGMREVEAALAREQKLAPHRRHGVKHVHDHPRLGQHFCGHETRRTTADDGHVALQSLRGLGKYRGCIGRRKGWDT